MVEAAQYDELRDALDKLQLNDAALVYEAETSQALGFGFVGFSGAFAYGDHQERAWEREYSLAF